ncbi:hypothetical protein ACXJJ3_35820 [Kribbella sp. WER1]
MYDMYPANWPAVDGRERKVARRRRPARPAPAREVKAVQEAMNRRDNGGEPNK